MNNSKTDGQRMMENGHYGEYSSLLQPKDCGTHEERTPASVISDWCEDHGYFQLAKFWRERSEYFRQSARQH